MITTPRGPSFLAVSLLATLAAAQEEPSVPTFKSQVDLVTVDVVVVDGKGLPVRGLSRDDFAIIEDGRPQPIASFEAVALLATEEEALPRPAGPVATNVRPSPAGARIFVLLVDDMSLAPARAEDLRKALHLFVSESLREGDEVIFTTSSGDAWWSARMPAGREDILALVARVRGRDLRDSFSDYVSEWEAFRINTYESLGGLEGGGGTGPPSGTSTPSVRAPGVGLTQRVFDRFMARRVCDPLAAGLCYMTVRGRAREVDERRRNRTRDVLAAVDRAVFALTGLRGRKSLLLLTEGFLNDPALSTVQAVASRCREANLAVYSLDVRGLMVGGGISAEQAGMPNTSELTLMQMEETDFVSAGSEGLAEDTGGLAVKNTNDLDGAVARIALESRVYYLLGYAPPEGKGPRDWRKLKVEVGRPGLKVRARKGYTLRTSAEIAGPAAVAGGSPAPSLPPDMRRALATAHDLDAIPLRAMAYVQDGLPENKARVLLAFEADLASLANLGGEGRPRAALSVSIAATHRDSGKTERVNQVLAVDAGLGGAFARWLVLSRELTLSPGIVQARVVVRDEFLGRVGAVSLRFEVPRVDGLRISTPILSDRVTKAPGGAPQVVALARREFSLGGVVYCQYEVFGAVAPPESGPQVEASYELRRVGGEVLKRGTPSRIAPSGDGRLVRRLGFPMDGLATGDYEIVLRVEDKTTGEVRHQVEPLRLVKTAS